MFLHIRVEKAIKIEYYVKKGFSMCMVCIPEWIRNSPYLIEEPEWHLSKDAPEELKKKFQKWIESI